MPTAPGNSPARIGHSVTSNTSCLAGLSIYGLGEKHIAFSYQQGWVKEPSDIFTLREPNGKLVLDGTAEIIRLEEVARIGRPGAQICSTPSRRGANPLERLIYALASATSARP